MWPSFESDQPNVLQILPYSNKAEIQLGLFERRLSFWNSILKYETETDHGEDTVNDSQLNVTTPNNDDIKDEL